MKKVFTVLLALVLLSFAAAPAPATAAPLSSTIPTFSIVSVVTDSTVTIRTYNFPANDTFKVLMGEFGTRGVNGIKVATTDSGAGGSFTATYNIPSGLKGLYRIAIRLQSTTGSGYYAYNWFYNNTSGSGTGTGTGTGYVGIPTFSIKAVIKDTRVTINTKNFPANDTFNVLMNYMHTKGVGGIVVDTISSGSGGAFEDTYQIPDALKGQYQIAIRLQSTSGSGYYAYNWFYNNTTGSGTGGGGVVVPPSYTGYPTFSILSVVRNQTVTVQAYNLPAGDMFDVLMGPMGTRGVGGYYVTTVDAGSGGTATFTFDIPSQLAGSYQIAIRMQSKSGTGYYAYNWFYNNTAY